MKIILFLFLTFDYSLNSGIEFIYDDNIFAYSQRYLDEFIHGLYPERFPFETYDDLCMGSYLQLLLKKKSFFGHKATINFNFKGYNYLVNNQKDYIIISTGIRQSFGNWSLRFKYLILPGYLIRYYKDPQGTEYLGCKFSEHLFSFIIDIMPKRKLSFSLNSNYEIDDYITNFDVYDSKAIRAGFVFEISSLRILKYTLCYEFKSSKAKGPIPDISFIQHELEFGLTLTPGFPKFSEIGVEYLLRNRFYTTEVSPLIDSPHSGRHDITQRFNLYLKFPIFPSLYVNWEYIYEFRRAHSDVYPQIGDYKDYNKWMAKGGLKFEY